MSDMSPLGRFVLVAMLWGARFSALTLAAIFALVVWQKWFATAAVGGARQDYAFLAIVGGLGVAAFIFARTVERELRK